MQAEWVFKDDFAKFVSVNASCQTILISEAIRAKKLLEVSESCVVQTVNLVCEEIEVDCVDPWIRFQVGQTS